MEKQNRRKICRNKIEFQTVFPPPPNPPEGDEDGLRHNNKLINQKGDLVDQQIFPYPVPNFNTAKDFII